MSSSRSAVPGDDDWGCLDPSRIFVDRPSAPTKSMAELVEQLEQNAHFDAPDWTVGLPVVSLSAAPLPVLTVPRTTWGIDSNTSSDASSNSSAASSKEASPANGPPIKQLPKKILKKRPRSGSFLSSGPATLKRVTFEVERLVANEAPTAGERATAAERLAMGLGAKPQPGQAQNYKALQAQRKTDKETEAAISPLALLNMGGPPSSKKRAGKGTSSFASTSAVPAKRRRSAH